MMLQRGRARAGAEITADKFQTNMNDIGFNGAAPARARKFTKIIPIFGSSFGFNGAAPARARK